LWLKRRCSRLPIGVWVPDREGVVGKGTRSIPAIVFGIDTSLYGCLTVYVVPAGRQTGVALLPSEFRDEKVPVEIGWMKR